MFENDKISVLICARGGSKGLPGKNIKNFAGKPLIAWTIESALASQYIDAVYVSTDCEQIGETARSFGAEFPFLRPKELSLDSSKSIDAVLHAIQWLEKNDRRPDVLMCLQTTSPLRETEDINNALEMLYTNPSARAVVSVCRAEHPPYWINKLDEKMCMKDFYPDMDIADGNRQDNGDYYRIHGAIDIGFTDYVIQQRSFLGPETYAYRMSAENSMDIDNELDFKIAEFLFKQRQNERLIKI